MNESRYVPADPSAVEWDVAVIGTGMGGATLGYGLAKRGRRVLFIEKGLLEVGRQDARGRSSARAAGLDDEARERLSDGWWPVPIEGRTSFGDIEFYAPLGCGAGGTTLLYAAALERLSPADFRPKANFPHVSDSTLPDRWPISYEELEPYYVQAEELFRVRGTPDPLQRGEAPSLMAPPPLSERDQHFFESFQRLGLHPYRVHAGYEFVDGCDQCPSQICTRQCKSDARRICLIPALEQHGAGILPQCEVVGLEADSSAVRSILCRRGDTHFSVRAKIIVLAAGALMTPVLLLNSRCEEWPAGLANRSGMVGRNLMMHASDFIAIRPTKRVSIEGPHKSLGVNDFYLSNGEKLGTFQAAGAAVSPGQIMQFMRDSAERDPTWWKKVASPRPIWWRKLSSPAIRMAALVMYYLFNFRNAAVWATIVEDLPYFENRVVANPGARNGMHFEYRYPEELKARVRSFRGRLAQALKPHATINLSGENNLNFGHVCGTCRFGDDPATNVLDRNNRAHEISNLYVVDASFFPSSGGTNPTLTIAANALRVAEVIHRQLA
jgi:choline dehydrogenase-like flavoprotein